MNFQNLFENIYDQIKNLKIKALKDLKIDVDDILELFDSKMVSKNDSNWNRFTYPLR